MILYSWAFSPFAVLGTDDYSKFIAAIRKLEKLINLRLNFATDTRLKDKSITLLSETLPNLKKLSQLTLRFDHCTSLSEDAMGSLMNCFKGMTKLKFLGFSIQGCKKIGAGMIKGLAGYFEEKSNKLKDLRLDFSDAERINDDCLVLLGIGISKMYRLRNIAMCLSSKTNSSIISDRGLAGLTAGLGELKSLNAFSINIERCISFTDSGFINGLKNLSQCISITSLTLDVQGCLGITDAGITQSIPFLTKLRNLDYLYIFVLKISVPVKVQVENALSKVNSVFIQSNNKMVTFNSALC